MQPAKAESPISSSPSGTVTVTSPSQFSNICAEMPVSDAGRVISVRLRQR